MRDCSTWELKRKKEHFCAHDRDVLEKTRNQNSYIVLHTFLHWLAIASGSRRVKIQRKLSSIRDTFVPTRKWCSIRPIVDDTEKKREGESKRRWKRKRRKKREKEGKREWEGMIAKRFVWSLQSTRDSGFRARVFYRLVRKFFTACKSYMTLFVRSREIGFTLLLLFPAFHATRRSQF